MAKKGIEVSITGVSEPVARELLRAIADRKETLEKVSTNCLREGQQAAAAKIKGSIDDLYEIFESIESQLGITPDDEAEESEEEAEG